MSSQCINVLTTHKCPHNTQMFSQYSHDTEISSQRCPYVIEMVSQSRNVLTAQRCPHNDGFKLKVVLTFIGHYEPTHTRASDMQSLCGLDKNSTRFFYYKDKQASALWRTQPVRPLCSSAPQLPAGNSYTDAMLNLDYSSCLIFCSITTASHAGKCSPPKQKTIEEGCRL